MSGKPGTARASLAFTVAGLCGAGAAINYAFGAQTQVMGALVGGAFVALAFGLLMWGRHFVPDEMVVEPHEPFASPRHQYELFQDALDDGMQRVPRVVRRTLLLGLGTIGAAFLFPLRSLYFGKPSPLTLLAHTQWAPGVRLLDDERKPIKPDDLGVGEFLTAIPETSTEVDKPWDSIVVLVRLDPAEYELTAASMAGTVDGIICFSKVCTHAGCPVGLFDERERELLCPCHQSVFDVRRGAIAIQGPASRPLPQLPIHVNDAGYLAADRDFSVPVGPTYWRKYKPQHPSGGSS